ncbi:WD40-repeat-containing domain protein [Syncephalis plumigaleata]|nr:WD40-repeat-containing domain protein [Syncephalis plumigaleata]
MSSQSVTLGWVTVQPDFADILAELVQEKSIIESVWISCYNKDTGHSVHETLSLERVTNGSTDVKIKAEGQKQTTIHVDPSKNLLQVGCEALSIPLTNCYGAIHTRNLLQPSFTSMKRITAIDISPGGALFVVGGDMPSSSLPQLQVAYMNPSGEQRAKLEGHKMTVTSLQFFPSGQVILSGADDFQLRIWSALDGSNPVTLSGHTSGITCTAIIDRGRNVLSASRDGTVRLWHCGEACEIAKIVHYSNPINHIALVQDNSRTDQHESSESIAPIDSREVGTHDKILVCAVDNGVLCGIQLATREKIFELTMPDHTNTPMTAAAMSGEWVMGGNSEGWLAVFHVPTQECKLVFRRNQTKISYLAVQKINQTDNTLESCRWWITTTDGQCYCVQFVIAESSNETNALSVKIIHELIGSDLDEVIHLHLPTAVVCNNKDDNGNSYQKISTVTVDGVLREYHIPLL